MVSRSSYFVIDESTAGLGTTTEIAARCDHEEDSVATGISSGGAGGSSSAPRETTRFKFPFKLHRLLEDAADQGNEHIVSWLPDGKSFKIHSKEEFEILILPRYYTTSFSPKYRSFCRQLTIYGFHRGKDPSVADFDAYSHPLFIRNMPALCQGMTREKAMHKKFDTIKDATEHGDKTREEFLGLAPLEERKEPALVPQEEVPMTRTQGDGLLEFAIIANKFLETKSSFQSMNDICRMSNDVLHDFQQQDHLKQQQLDAAFDGIKGLLILSYPSPSTAHV